MITRAMRAQLSELGYATEEVDRMDPPRAASIIAKRVPSSKQAQKKPKSKRERFELQFTCNVCDAPNVWPISCGRGSRYSCRLPYTFLEQNPTRSSLRRTLA